MEGLILKLKLQYFDHLKQGANSLENTLMLGKIEGRRRGQQRMRWLDSNRVGGQEFEQTPGDGGEQGSLACYSPWSNRVRHDLATEPGDFCKVFLESFKARVLKVHIFASVKSTHQRASFI